MDKMTRTELLDSAVARVVARWPSVNASRKREDGTPIPVTDQRLTTRKTPQSEWSRANEAKRLHAGGRRIPGGILPADAAQALDTLRDAGYASSYAGCIARALTDAAKSRPRSR